MGHKQDWTIRLKVYADEADVAELQRVAGKTERVYIVTAGMSGHLEVDEVIDYDDSDLWDRGKVNAEIKRIGNSL